MKIRKATDQDAEVWDNYSLKHPDGLAYHRFAWKRAVEEAYGFESCYLLAENKGRICGIFPLIVFARPFLGRKYVSLPYCDIGGCLADDVVIETQLIGRAKELGNADSVSAIEYRTGRKNATSDVFSGDCQKVRMILELPESSEVFLNSLKSKLRSQVKKPLRDGLTAKLGGLELVADFYRVFSANMRDLGSPVHSLEWIHAVVSHYGENVRVGLVLTPEGELAAAGIILLHRDTVSIPWASSLRCFNRLNPNMLLYWTFLAFAADNGYRYFDFGRSTPGEGTYKFKEQWGAEPVPLSWIDLASRVDTGVIPSESSLRIAAERIWKKLPLGFCNTFGPWLRKYISL